MAKTHATPQVDDTQSAEPVTVDEFCILLSHQDRRVELIGAFNFAEKQFGRIKDTAAQFRARFDAFANTPV